MSYCVTSTVRTILPMLPQTTSASPEFTSSSVVIAKHIQRADGIIDGYCARRYALPFTAIPPMIRAISQDLVSYYTYRSYFTQDNHNRSEYFEDLYGQARADLEYIRDGKIDLVDTAGSAAPLMSTTSQSLLDSTTKNYQSAFDVDDPLDWKFDGDLLDSIRGRR